MLPVGFRGKLVMVTMSRDRGAPAMRAPGSTWTGASWWVRCRCLGVDTKV
jgi:hypothetical protein